MALPGIKNTIIDPGLGLTSPAGSVPLLLGTCSQGTENQLYSLASVKAVVDTLGQGPLAEAAAHVLQVAGGPVLCLRLTGTAGTVTDDAGNPAMPTLTVSGNPNDAYTLLVQVVETGTPDNATTPGAFRYTLDGGMTWSSPVPMKLSFPINGSGLSLTFEDAEFTAGAQYRFDCTAPSYTSTELATAVQALETQLSTKWDFLVLVGTPASAAAGGTLFTALHTHMDSFANQFRYARAIMDVGAGTPAEVITAFSDKVSKRVMPCYSTVRLNSAKPMIGWSVPSVSTVLPIAARAARAGISEHLGRVLSGPLPSVVSIGHDEYQDQGLDEKGIATLRTFPGRAGYFVTRPRLKAPEGSDFTGGWHLGRLMDVVCDTVSAKMMERVNSGVRTIAGGQIDERDAVRLETPVNSALSTRLLEPTNAEGVPGHVSFVKYTTDRTNNVLVSGVVQGTVAVRPQGYVETIETTIGFTVGGE